MSLSDVTNTMQVLLGSSYVNDFDFNGRSYRVYVQADQQFRSKPEDIERYYARTSAGRMMPLSDVVTVREATAPKVITHYNLFRSAEINGAAAPGFSSGQAMQVMQAAAVFGPEFPDDLLGMATGVTDEEVAGR